MIEDTPSYREMMRMTHDDFLEILRLMVPDITPRPLWECQVLLASSRMLYLAYLLSDIPLKIHPAIGMHFTPILIDQKIRFFVVPFPCLSFAFVYDSAFLR